VEAERTILGAILLDNAAYSEAAQLKAGIVIGFWDQAALDEATPSPPGSAPGRR